MKKLLSIAVLLIIACSCYNTNKLENEVKNECLIDSVNMIERLYQKQDTVIKYNSVNYVVMDGKVVSVYYNNNTSDVAVAILGFLFIIAIIFELVSLIGKFIDKSNEDLIK